RHIITKIRYASYHHNVAGSNLPIAKQVRSTLADPSIGNAVASSSGNGDVLRDGPTGNIQPDNSGSNSVAPAGFRHRFLQRAREIQKHRPANDVVRIL